MEDNSNSILEIIKTYPTIVKQTGIVGSIILSILILNKLGVIDENTLSIVVEWLTMLVSITSSYISPYIFKNNLCIIVLIIGIIIVIIIKMNNDAKLREHLFKTSQKMVEQGKGSFLIEYKEGKKKRLSLNIQEHNNNKYDITKKDFRVISSSSVNRQNNLEAK